MARAPIPPDAAGQRIDHVVAAAVPGLSVSGGATPARRRARCASTAGGRAKGRRWVRGAGEAGAVIEIDDGALAAARGGRAARAAIAPDPRLAVTVLHEDEALDRDREAGRDAVASARAGAARHRGERHRGALARVRGGVARSARGRPRPPARHGHERRADRGARGPRLARAARRAHRRRLREDLPGGGRGGAGGRRAWRPRRSAASAAGAGRCASAADVSRSRRRPPGR